MKCSPIIAAAVLVSSTIASPTAFVERHARRCVSHAQAEQFVHRFKGILNKRGSGLGDYLQTANKLLADDFQEILDSINTLAESPLGSVTAPSKEAYLAGIRQAPASTGLDTISISVTRCRDVLWHWKFKGVGSAQYPVKGYNQFSMTPNLSLRVPWVVSELQIEFNGIAWALNTGYGFVRRNGTTLGRQGDCAASSAEEGTAAPIVDVMVEGVSPDAPPAAYQAGAPANTSATST